MQIQETEHTPQQQDRVHLKKLSDQRAARWPDTLQARVLSTWLTAAAHAAMPQPVHSSLPGMAAVPCVHVYRRHGSAFNMITWWLSPHQTLHRTGIHTARCFTQVQIERLAHVVTSLQQTLFSHLSSCDTWACCQPLPA